VFVRDTHIQVFSIEKDPSVVTDKPSIILIGDDPSLAYLLERYAYRAGYRLQYVCKASENLDLSQIQPQSIWFSSLDVLENYQPQKDAILACDVPIVVCSSIAEDARAMDLGADYLLLHPLTYDSFLGALSRS
jgi:ActR/RegA family two-component response regulator